MTKTILIIGAILLVGADAAWSQGLIRPSRRTGMWEIAVQTRYFGSQDIEGEGGSSVELEDDLGWAFGMAYNTDERFSFGGYIGWRTVAYTAHAIDAEPPITTIEYGDWMDTGTIAASMMWHILPSTLTPYISGSLGWVMVDTNIPAGVSTGCWWDPWWGYICGPYQLTYGDDGGVYSLGAGGSFQVTPNICFRAGYERSWLDVGEATGFDIFRADVAFLTR